MSGLEAKVFRSFLQRGRRVMAHSRDDGRPSWRPVIGVVLPPLWHQGHKTATLCPHCRGGNYPRIASERAAPTGSVGESRGGRCQRECDGRRDGVGRDPGARVVAAAWPQERPGLQGTTCPRGGFSPTSSRGGAWEAPLRRYELAQKDVHHRFMPSWAQTFASRSFSSCTSASRRATLAFTAASSEMPRDGDSAAKPAAEDD
jgi:hypothetical protein